MNVIIYKIRLSLTLAVATVSSVIDLVFPQITEQYTMFMCSIIPITAMHAI